MKATTNYLRPRVTLGWPLYKEYICNHLVQEGYFEDTMKHFLRAKNYLKDMTGWEPNFKAHNREWGKKNRSKKAQLRTIIEFAFWPTIVGSVCLLVSAMLAINLVCYLCCSSKRKIKNE